MIPDLPPGMKPGMYDTCPRCGGDPSWDTIDVGLSDRLVVVHRLRCLGCNHGPIVAMLVDTVYDAVRRWRQWARGVTRRLRGERR